MIHDGSMPQQANQDKTDAPPAHKPVKSPDGNTQVDAQDDILTQGQKTVIYPDAPRKLTGEQVDDSENQGHYKKAERQTAGRGGRQWLSAS